MHMMMALDKSTTFPGLKFKLLIDVKEDGGMGRETRGNFSDVEEDGSGATEIGSDNNRLKSSPDYSEIKIEGEVSKRHLQAQANPSSYQYAIVSNP